MSVVYRGRRLTGMASTVSVISVNGETLPLRQDLRRLSPVFDWGNNSRGAFQLAVALLAHCMGERAAVDLWPAFHRRIVAGLPSWADWTLSDQEVRDVVAEIEAEAITHGKWLEFDEYGRFG